MGYQFLRRMFSSGAREEADVTDQARDVPRSQIIDRPMRIRITDGLKKRLVGNTPHWHWVFICVMTPLFFTLLSINKHSK